MSFVVGNPVKYTDPTGHWTEDQLEDALGKDWYNIYFGAECVFENRKKLLELLQSKNTTDPLSLAIIKAFFETANSSGLDSSNIDALGARLVLSGGAIGSAGVTVDAILNLTSGEFSVFGSLEGGFAIGETAALVGGVTLLKNLPSNQGYWGVAKAVGIMGGDIIGLNVEGFAGGVPRFQDPNTVMEGGFVGAGAAVPGIAVYGSLSYAWELLRVDQAGYSAFLNRPSLYDVIGDIGEVLWVDVFNLP